jgi:hypothetical protein
VTPGSTWYTRTHGIGWRDFENSASFIIAGFFVAIETWHEMQVLVAGNVIRFPDAGFVWQVAQGNPSARCVL